MIIDFSYDVDSYQELLAHYGNWPYICPVCNAVGQWQRHGTYLRYLLVSEDDGYESGSENRIDLNTYYQWKTHHMKILRIRCKSCQHTHAILTKDMVPYAISSIRSIIKVYCHKLLGQSVTEAEKRDWMSHQQFYYCIKNFEQMRLKLQELTELEEVRVKQWWDDLGILKSLFDISRSPVLECSFFQKHQWPFLMRRKNTDQCLLFVAIFC